MKPANDTPAILLVEDDAAITRGLRYALEQDGFSVTVAATAAAARAALGQGRYDLLLLDLTLPDGSGFDICRAARRDGDTPVIFLTACDDEIHTVMGLDMGADDYITKPFRIRELQSRIRAVLRRHGRQASLVSLPGGVRVDLARAQVSRDGEPIPLTALEYKLLLTFLGSPNRVLSRGQLLAGIWDDGGNFVNDNTLTVCIKRLRAKLETPGATPLIATVRGMGYRLEVE